MTDKIIYIEAFIMGKGKKRIIETNIWYDEYFRQLLITEKNDKFCMIWWLLLTSPLSEISGVYQMHSDFIQFCTGYEETVIESALQRFERDGKIKRQGTWICIQNFIRHQNLSMNMKKGVINGFMDVPVELINWLFKNIEILRLVKSYPGYEKLEERITCYDMTVTGSVTLPGAARHTVAS